MVNKSLIKSCLHELLHSVRVKLKYRLSECRLSLGYGDGSSNGASKTLVPRRLGSGTGESWYAPQCRKVIISELGWYLWATTTCPCNLDASWQQEKIPMCASRRRRQDTNDVRNCGV